MMLVIVTAACIALAYDQRFRRQHQAADYLAEAAGAKITYYRSPVGWLPGIGDKLRDVQAVDLSHCRVDSDSVKLLLHFPRLQRLYLARTNVDDKDLAVVAELRHLERLALWHTKITDRGVAKLVSLKKLQVLDAHGTSLTENSLESLSKLKRLREVKYDFNQFSDRGLGFLPAMPNRPLGELWCRSATDAGIQSLGQIDSKHYRITRLLGSDISDAALLKLAPDGQTLPVGPVLHVRDCPATDRLLDALPWDRLTDVRFSETKVTFDAVAEIVGDRMGVLVIGENGYELAEGRDWESSRCFAPTGLSIWMDGDPTQLTSQQIAKLKNLQGVVLARQQSAGDLLVHLAQHPGLTHFKMTSVPTGTAVIEQISDWKGLRYAYISCCNPPTAFDIRPLAKLEQLRWLLFTCTPFGDDGFETLGKMSQLRVLRMTSADKVQGPGLKHLRNLQHLERFKIQSRANWDASFDHLMALQHVKRIELIDVKMSDANLKAFNDRRGWEHDTWQ